MADNAQHRGGREGLTATDTIAAIATPGGAGALAVVRVSGAKAASIATALVGRVPPARRASYLTVRDAQAIPIDDAVVLYFAAPASFTGEDTLEIQCHGGNIVAREILEAAVRAGARYARAGEFSERAFLNGRIDLLQAEAIADLITSSSVRAARLARASMAGAFSTEVHALTAQLRSARVHVEAAIDFADEPIETASVEALVTTVRHVSAATAELLQRATQGAQLNDGIDIAIVGRPNVGKSTLLNALARDEIAIVDHEPGTTRDVLSVAIVVDSIPVRFHDTAGIRDTGNRIEREGVNRARRKLADADAVLYVFSDDEDALDTADTDHNGPVFRVRNKIDRDGLPVVAERRGNDWYLQLSAKRGDGVDALRDAIGKTFAGGTSGTDNAILARARHLEALREVHEALACDAAALLDDAPELLAERLRVAMHALSMLTGEYSSEDLLGDIFSTFCIGK